MGLTCNISKSIAMKCKMVTKLRKAILTRLENNDYYLFDQDIRVILKTDKQTHKHITILGPVDSDMFTHTQLTMLKSKMNFIFF